MLCVLVRSSFERGPRSFKLMVGQQIVSIKHMSKWYALSAQICRKTTIHVQVYIHQVAGHETVLWVLSAPGLLSSAASQL